MACCSCFTPWLPDVWAFLKFALCSLFSFSTCNCSSYTRSGRTGLFACICWRRALGRYLGACGCGARVCACVTCVHNACVCGWPKISTARQRIFLLDFLFTTWIYTCWSIQYSVISYQYSVISKAFIWDANAYHLRTICGAFGVHLVTKGVHLVCIWYSFVLHLVRIWESFGEDGKICGDLWNLRAAWLCPFTWELQVREQISDDRAISRAVQGAVVTHWAMKGTTMKEVNERSAADTWLWSMAPAV